jgi:hypothetical protein
VDDLIICGPSVKEIAEFKRKMKQSFDMSDLGLLTYYLGLEVRQTINEINHHMSEGVCSKISGVFEYDWLQSK